MQGKHSKGFAADGYHGAGNVARASLDFQENCISVDNLRIIKNHLYGYVVSALNSPLLICCGFPLRIQHVCVVLIELICV